MKKILVVSDSHGNVEPMMKAVRIEHPDLIIHLGDVNKDAQELIKAFPDIPVETVYGNCDLRSDVLDKVLIYEGKRIFMTHGHKYSVKSSLLNLQYAAKEKEADIVLFGHTHRLFYDVHNRMHFLNPGSIGESRLGSPLTYGLVIIEDGQIFLNTGYIN